MKKSFLLVSPENYFRLNNGLVLKDIGELYLAMKKMEGGVYSHHVTPEKNDFANWIEFVFKNKVLAKEVSKSRSQKETESLLNKFLSDLKKNLLKEI